MVRERARKRGRRLRERAFIHARVRRRVAIRSVDGACEQSSGDEARRALRLPIIAAQFYIVRATHTRDINDANTLSETDELMARALDAVDASVLAPAARSIKSSPRAPPGTPTRRRSRVASFDQS